MFGYGCPSSIDVAEGSLTTQKVSSLQRTIVVTYICLNLALME